MVLLLFMFTMIWVQITACTGTQIYNDTINLICFNV